MPIKPHRLNFLYGCRSHKMSPVRWQLSTTGVYVYVFSRKLSPLTLLLAVTLSPLAVFGEEKPYYMWRDAEGVLNFAQLKPMNDRVKVEEISKPHDFGRQIPREEPPPPVIPSEVEIANEQTRAANCEYGQKTLEKLQTQVNIFMRDAEGWWREVSDEKRQEEVTKAQQAIVENCPKGESG